MVEMIETTHLVEEGIVLFPNGGKGNQMPDQFTFGAIFELPFRATELLLVGQRLQIEHNKQILVLWVLI